MYLSVLCVWFSKTVSINHQHEISLPYCTNCPVLFRLWHRPQQYMDRPLLSNNRNSLNNFLWFSEGYVQLFSFSMYVFVCINACVTYMLCTFVCMHIYTPMHACMCISDPERHRSLAWSSPMKLNGRQSQSPPCLCLPILRLQIHARILQGSGSEE